MAGGFLLAAVPTSPLRAELPASLRPQQAELLRHAGRLLGVLPPHQPELQSKANGLRDSISNARERAELARLGVELQQVLKLSLLEQTSLLQQRYPQAEERFHAEASRIRTSVLLSKDIGELFGLGSELAELERLAEGRGSAAQGQDAIAWYSGQGNPVPPSGPSQQVLESLSFTSLESFRAGWMARSGKSQGWIDQAHRDLIAYWETRSRGTAVGSSLALGIVPEGLLPHLAITQAIPQGFSTKAGAPQSHRPREQSPIRRPPILWAPARPLHPIPSITASTAWTGPGTNVSTTRQKARRSFDAALDASKITIAGTLNPVDVILRNWDTSFPSLMKRFPFQRHTPQRFTIHHTDGGRPTSEKEAIEEAREIILMHRRTNHWRDVGYHYLIDGAGRIIVGRPVEAVGAHTEDHNTGNVGIAFMGNYERRDQLSREQIEALVTLIVKKSREYKISPKTRDFIQPHSRYNSTDCPGNNVIRHLPSIRQRVQEELAKK